MCFPQVLLAMRTNVEDRGMKGDCTPLLEAALAGHTDIVRLLISPEQLGQRALDVRMRRRSQGCGQSPPRGRSQC